MQSPNFLVFGFWGFFLVVWLGFFCFLTWLDRNLKIHIEMKSLSVHGLTAFFAKIGLSIFSLDTEIMT